ncbi:MAG: hypothetical protein WDM79_06710 [Terricaulis sp.]
MRLGDSAPNRVAAWGHDPRAGDAARGAELAKGVWRIAAERMAGEYAVPWERPHPSHHFTARLHAFAWLVDLAAAGADARIVQLIESWVGEHGDWDELAWDPELTAERLFAWLCWGRPAFEQGRSGAARGVVAFSGATSALTAAGGKRVERSPWRRDQGGARRSCSLAPPAFPDANRLIEQGEEMLLEACAKQFFT